MLDARVRRRRAEPDAARAAPGASRSGAGAGACRSGAHDPRRLPRSRRRSTFRPSARTFRSCAERVHGKPLVYLDNAATTQKPQAVIDRIARYYTARERQRASRRPPAERAGDRRLRGRARNGAPLPERRPTRRKSSSCAARPRRSTSSRTATAGRTSGAGDEVVDHRDGAPLEHRAVADALRGEGRAAARRADDRRGRAAARRVRAAARPSARRSSRSCTCRTRSAPSIPIAEIVRLAHSRGIPVLVDGAQAVAHMPVDVRALDCDFYAFSGHKIFGPTGIGVALRQGGAARRDAAVSGRRRHDQLGHLRADALQRAAVQVRSRHAEHRRRRRAGRGARVRGGGSASSGSPRTSTTCSPTAPMR